MNFAKINKNDIVNGKGVSVSFWSQGCPHRCEGCHNKETWDFTGGKEFTQDTIDEVLQAIGLNGIERNLSILGGEPLVPVNLKMINDLIVATRERYPNISIYMWTGYVFEHLNQKQLEETKIERPVLYYSDDLKNSLKAKVPNSEKVIEGVIDNYNGLVPTYRTQSEKITAFDSSNDLIQNTCNESSDKLSNLNTTSLEIPYGDCSSFMFMDYRTLTDTSSKQWELQQYAYDGDSGIREVDGCYCVALGTVYGSIGDKFRVTTDRGNVYNVIMADAKGADAVSYDDYNSWYHVCGDYRINLIEFVVDGDLIPNECWQMGEMGVIDDIGGNVVSIERI